MTRVRHALLLVLATAAMLATMAGPALAHGEQTQEAFLRASTVLLYDVEVSDTELAVNDTFTVTGRLRLMESWPRHTIVQPEVGYLSLVTPGPVVTIEDRRLNDVFTPQSVHVGIGETYAFAVTAKARVPGRHHIHPSFAIEGVGTLAGTGTWIEIVEGDQPWSSEVTLASGGTIDLASFGTGRVWTWHLVSLAVGLLWLGWWLRRPLLARAGAVDEGHGAALVERADRRLAVVMVGLVALVLVAGNVLAQRGVDGPLLPLQVARLSVDPLPAPEPIVEANVAEAAWRSEAGRLEVTLDVTNTGARDLTLTRMQMAEFEVQDHMTVTPAGAIRPGERATLTLSLDGAFLEEHNLLPLSDPQLRFTALLFFTDSAGTEQVAEVDEVTAPVLPL